jgi:uncharacterized protein YdhG (YjbR/CyaY superfamily)
MAYHTVDNYIEAQPVATRAVLFQLKECILEAVPEAEEIFNYGIPAFALKKGGTREQQIMMAGYKNHVGFYPHPTTMAKFSRELEGYKQGKGSVQFPHDQPLPKELIVTMVRYRKRLIEDEA